MESNKYKVRGIIGTVVFHSLLILALILCALKTPLPLPGEEGVEINLGYSETGMGNIQPVSQPKPEIAKITPRPTPKPTPQPVVKEKIVTQDTEEAPVIEKIKKEKKKPVKKKEEKVIPKKVEKEEPKKEVKQKTVDKPKEIVKEEPEPEPEPTVDPRMMYTGKNTKTDNNQGEGVAGGAGDQGKLYGNKDATSHNGNGGNGQGQGNGGGGNGSGISFSLAGRSALHLPKPSYNSLEQGKIVVTIYVNKEGKVSKAIAGAKGTNISDLGLRRLAEQAAMEAKFTPDPDAPAEQKGTITYNFIRLQ